MAVALILVQDYPSQVGGWWQRAGHSNVVIGVSTRCLGQKRHQRRVTLWSWCWTDLRYPPSSISLHPEQHVGTGTNVTIRCWNKDYGATFLLHKDGSSDPIKHQNSSGGGTATFTLFGVTPADSGTYRCSYRPWRYAFMSSPLGDSVMLEVTPTAAPPGTPKLPDPTGTEEQSRANVVMALVRGFVAALVFGLGVFFVIDARSLWIRRDDNCGAPPVTVSV
eukprot:XP_025002058.1 LOW QUALITY PROTEIN: osteoclast-associated immunoglobulin-like receptor [Gallus gallus]